MIQTDPQQSQLQSLILWNTVWGSWSVLGQDWEVACFRPSFWKSSHPLVYLKESKSLNRITFKRPTNQPICVFVLFLFFPVFVKLNTGAHRCLELRTNVYLVPSICDELPLHPILVNTEEEEFNGRPNEDRR